MCFTITLKSPLPGLGYVEDAGSDVRLGKPRGFLRFRAYPSDDSHTAAAHGFQCGFARDMPISNSKFESGRTCLPLG